MRIYYLAFILVLVTPSCASSDSNSQKMTKEEVAELINNELSAGTHADQIEQFFKRNEWVFSYDWIRQRYQGIIRDVSANPTVDHAIVIYIYVDESKRFVRSEVRDSFTAM